MANTAERYDHPTDMEPPESSVRPSSADQKAELDLHFVTLELPVDENKYLWAVGAVAANDGRTLGVGRHHLKGEARKLAETEAKKSIAQSRLDERLRLVGLGPEVRKPPAKPRRRPPTRKRREEVDRLHRTIRELSDERGRRSEDRVFEAFTEGPNDAPAWFKGVRRPTPEQDLFHMVDAVVETTDAGEVYIQVKSSFTGLNRFLNAYHPADVRGIVVTLDLQDEKIRSLVYDAAGRLRAKRLRGEI